MYINTQLNLFKIASLLVSLYYMSAADASISILGSSDGVNYLDIVKDTISPPYSNFIGAQYNSPLCNIPSLDLVQTVAVDASTNQLKINNLCFGFGKEINPELKAAVKGKALLIPDIVDGFGACSIEHKYLKLINDFEVAAIISVSEGVPGVRMNAHDGSRGANTLGDSYPPLLEITIPNKDQLQIIKKATSLKLQIKNCDISPWKEVFEGPVWMTLNVINAILYFFVSFIAARNIVLFRQRQRAGSKISKDINVIYVILVFIVGGSVTMAFVFALGFAYSTPLINFGSAQAFISMLSGVSIFPLFLNALYFREYSLSVMKIRQPRNVFQCYKKSIIAGAIVFLGVDTFRQITASFYYSVGTVPASAFYLLSNLFVAASFLYESEKFIRHIRNSVRANNDAKRESKSMASQISSAVSDLTSRFTKDGKNVHANSESGSIKATRSKHGESLQKKREDPLKKFIQKMAYWLRFCALFQILWLGSLPLIVLGYIKIPQGNLIFGVLMSIARFGTTYCQARALSPHSYQGKSSSSSGEDGSASSPKKDATSKEGHLSISSTSPKSKVSKNESKVSDNVSPSKSFILNAKSSSKGILPATSASNPESLADSQSGSRNNSKVSMVVIPSPTNAPDPKANSAKIEALTKNDIEIEGAQFVLDEQDD